MLSADGIGVPDRALPMASAFDGRLIDVVHERWQAHCRATDFAVCEGLGDRVAWALILAGKDSALPTELRIYKAVYGNRGRRAIF